MDLTKLKKRLIEAGRLQDEHDIQLFETLAEHAPELLAFAFAAALAGVEVTDEKPKGKLN